MKKHNFKKGKKTKIEMQQAPQSKHVHFPSAQSKYQPTDQVEATNE